MKKSTSNIALLAFALLFIGCGLSRAQERAPQLMLWLKADDLGTLKDGDRVGRWLDASGQERDAKAEGDARPTYSATAVDGKPGVVFQKLAAPNAQSILLPLSGEWSGATIFVVGRGLNGPGWFDSLPGLESDLRALGYVQLTGDKLGIDRGFPDLADSTKPELAVMRVGIKDDGAMKLETFAGGKLQGEATDPNPRFGVGWHPDRSRLGSELFEGAIAEVLVYKGALSDAQRQAVEKYLSAKYGLSAAANAPQMPVGFPVASKTQVAVKPPPVQGEPARAGLKFWMRADELQANDNEPVSEVPNFAGDEPAKSEGQHRPRFVASALNGRGVLRFDNDAQTPREEVKWLQLPPTLQGTANEITFIAVGRKLLNAGVLDTAPGNAQTLRHSGVIQHIGGLTLEQPFPFLRLKQQGMAAELHDEGQISTIVIGKLGEAGQYIASFADGQIQERKESPDKIAPILFRESYLGTNNRGETRFDGDLAEVLIYDRALTEAERKQTETYLAQKWGVPLRNAGQIAAIENARSRWSLTRPKLPHTQSWFANTLSGKKEDGWVQAGIADITALPDGTVVAISIWDEQHKEIGFYKDGKAAGGLKAGGGAIATDGQYLYAAVSGYAKLFAGVRRLTLDGKDAPWPDLPPADFGDWGKPQAIRFDVPKAWTEVRSIAAGNGELYVSIDDMNDVRVYDAATGAFKRALAMTPPGELAIDKAGKLWVGLPDGVARFNADGTSAGAKISGVVAGGMAVDGKGVLWVADNGQRQQIIGYDVSGTTPRETKTIGEKSGVFGAPRPGQLTDNRILPPRGLAIDAAGNFTVLGTNVMRNYAPDGKVRWTLEATAFTTTSDFDPTKDGAVIYTGLERYDYVPGAPPGRDWKLSGFTGDPRRFPELTNGGNQTILRNIGGHLLRYSPSDPVVVHRQETNSDIFVPAAVVVRQDQGGFHPTQPRPKAAPEKGRFAWSDKNANGLVEDGEFSLPKADAKRFTQSFSAWIDTEGGIWEPMDREGLRYLPLKEITAQGVPIYDLADELWFEKPKEFMQVMRVLYLPREDTMLVTGTTWEHPAIGTEHWGTSGREVICYSDWKKPTRKLKWRTAFPTEAPSLKAVTVAPAANLFFAGEMETETIFAYDLRDGKFLGILEPERKLVGDIGWIDIDQGIRAFTRKSGEVLLLAEEVWGQKQMVYRIKKVGK